MYQDFLAFGRVGAPKRPVSDGRTRDKKGKQAREDSRNYCSAYSPVCIPNETGNIGFGRIEWVRDRKGKDLQRFFTNTNKKYPTKLGTLYLALQRHVR